MKNLDYLLTKTDIPSYNKEEITEIIRKENKILGPKMLMTLCMEEFAELIEVITDINLRGRIDYIHLIEEMADCEVSLYRIASILELNPVKYKQTFHSHKEDTCIQNCTLLLSTSIIKLSKYIREKQNADLHLFTIINDIREALSNLAEYFEIDRKDLIKVINLKAQRIDQRNIAAELKAETATTNVFSDLIHEETHKLRDPLLCSAHADPNLNVTAYNSEFRADVVCSIQSDPDLNPPLSE